jgi:nucleoside-diphosphate-sugar epimerase
MRILVTGGGGFVGRHFVFRLLNEGHDVHVVDSIYPGTGGIKVEDDWPLFDPRQFNNFTWDEIDCRIYFQNNKYEYFDLVFHLAAIVGGRLTIENNPLAVAEDLSIDSEMWKWATAAQPGKIICFSSSAAYPVQFQGDNPILLKEDFIKFEKNIGLPDLSYGWAKLTHEYLARLAFQRYGIKSVCYRPFSGYGPDQDLSYPFPSICLRALKGKSEDTFRVWGSGLQARDFIHIDDCVDGVMTTFMKIDNAEALNLSTGTLTSFIDFASLVTSIVGYTPKIIGDTSKPEGVKSRGGDTHKQFEYGFRDRISFKEGVERALVYLDKIK